MILNTSFRPTAYRDLHLGGTWNAYLNWLVAQRSGGEFVFVQDDMWMLLGACNGYPPDVAVERYVEDLRWLGMEPDRIEWGWRKPGDEAYTRQRAERHEWAARILGYRKPAVVGILPALSSPYALSFRADSFDDKAFCGMEPQPDEEGQGWSFTACFCPYHMACCVVDDIDFRVGAWVAGADQKLYHAWCLDAYWRLGYNPPLIMYHATVKKQFAGSKISKSDPPKPDAIDCTIRNLRGAGYTPDEILETLRECSYRSYVAGHEQVIIPLGVLEVETRGVLKHNLRALEAPARGEFPDEVPPDLRPHLRTAALQRIAEGTGAIRTP